MTSQSALQNIYEEHHRSGSREGFSILEAERGELFSQYIGTGKKILDIGCRDGTLTRYFTEGNSVTGVDIDRSLLSKAQDALGIQTMSFDLNGPWDVVPASHFDVVVAGEIVEHLYAPSAIFKKAAHALVPGGILVGSVPNAFNLKNRIRYACGIKEGTPLSDPTHINHFSVPELTTILKGVFDEVTIIGLGRHRWLARTCPSWCSFDIMFIARKHV